MAVVSHYNVQPVIDIFGTDRVAIWVEFRATSTRSSMQTAAVCPADRKWLCADRCRRCVLIYRASESAWCSRSCSITC